MTKQQQQQQLPFLYASSSTSYVPLVVDLEAADQRVPLKFHQLVAVLEDTSWQLYVLQLQSLLTRERTKNYTCMSSWHGARWCAISSMQIKCWWGCLLIWLYPITLPRDYTESYDPRDCIYQEHVNHRYIIIQPADHMGAQELSGICQVLGPTPYLPAFHTRLGIIISVTTLLAKVEILFSEFKVEEAFTNSRINRVIKLQTTFFKNDYICNTVTYCNLNSGSSAFRQYDRIGMTSSKSWPNIGPAPDNRLLNM